VQALLDNKIALWDVMQACQRQGSLDSAINQQSVVANNFAAFFSTHGQISHVFFNGATAEHTFNRLLLPELASLNLSSQRLPSSSPAHASLSFTQKLAAWQQAIMLVNVQPRHSR